MKVKIKNILPNPYRKFEHYPISRKKVDALKESFNRTTFWENIVGRKAGDKVELAHGHHRLIALKELYAQDTEVNIIVRNLTNAQMIQAMADENIGEWGSNADVSIETVLTVLQAYADGEIELPPFSVNTPPSQLAFAPSAICGKEPEAHGPRVSYSREQIAQFLGWGHRDTRRMKMVFMALEAIEQGFANHKDFENLSIRKAEEMASQMRQTANLAKKENKQDIDVKRDVKRVGKAIKKAYEDGAGSIDASSVALNARQAGTATSPVPPDISHFASRKAKQLHSIFSPNVRLGKELNEMIANKDFMSESAIHAVIVALDDLITTASNFKQALQKESNNVQTAKLR